MIKVKEYLPCGELARFIRHFWVMEDDEIRNHSLAMFPDGYIDMIFNFGGRCEYSMGGKINKPASVVFMMGQTTAPFTAKFSGKLKQIGVKFYPFAFGVFFDLPAHYATDAAHAVEDFGLKIGNKFIDNLFGVTGLDNSALIAKIEKHLIERGRERQFIHKEIVPVICSYELQKSSFGRMRIDELADSVNMSRRLLEMKYKNYIGVSPKALAGKLKILKSLELYDYKEIEISDLLGFADQAHFIRTFKSIFGMTPSFYFDNIRSKRSKISKADYMTKIY